MLIKHSRIRKLKCDEQKPCCSRCQRDCFSCEWFPFQFSRSGWSRSQLKPKPRLLPKGTKSVPSGKAASTGHVPLQPRSLRKTSRLAANPSAQPSQNLFGSDLEKRYSNEFCEKVRPQLAGLWSSPVWNRLILQASQQNEAVRHAIIAIGALDITMQVSSNSRFDSLGTIDKHHDFAVMQYSKAITKMRVSISEGRHDLRTTLLTSLLIMCFECLHGNHESAIAQMKGGIELLGDWLAQQQLHSADESMTGEASPELAAAAFGIHSPVPGIIEDE